MAERIRPGETFPTFSTPTAQGGTITVPEGITTRYSAVLFYRASW